MTDTKFIAVILGMISLGLGTHEDDLLKFIGVIILGNLLLDWLIETWKKRRGHSAP